MFQIADRTNVLSALFALILVAAIPTEAQTSISVDGVVESRSGGFRFPDGSIQTSAVERFPATVEDTGTKECFLASGNSRSCTGTGEDGEHQAGAAWPSRRLIDNLDGTILDRSTGLIWPKDANCLGSTTTWQGALTWVVVTLNFSPSLNCTDYTALTHQDWRLPNIKELLSLVDYGRRDPALPEQHPFVGIPATQTFYWSSSTVAFGSNSAWTAETGKGNNSTAAKTTSARVWAVRGGSLQKGGNSP